MFESLNESAHDLLKEVEAKKEANKSIAKNREFISNNWIKEGVDNTTLDAINKKGGAVWLDKGGEIQFRHKPTSEIKKLDITKAKTVLANFLDRKSIRIYNGTKEAEADIFANDILSVQDKFTPFVKSEFYSEGDELFRTAWKPTQYMNAEPSQIMPPNIKFLFERLTNDNPTYLEWVINWIAGFFQTLKRSQCALVLKGDQGSGKGILMEHIITPLFGEKYCTVIDNDGLESKFKEWVNSVLFYNFNEISHNDVKSRKIVKNFLKQLITDGKVRAEEKNQGAGSVEVFGQIIFFSNEGVPIEIEPTDRRYTVIQTNRGLKKDGVNTSALVENIKSELMAFASYLKGYKVNYVLFDTPLDTKEKRAIVNATTDKATLLGTALKDMDIAYLQQLEDHAVSLYNETCDNMVKGFVIRSQLVSIYFHLFDEEIKKSHLFNRLKNLDIDVFGQTYPYSGHQVYRLPNYKKNP